MSPWTALLLVLGGWPVWCPSSCQVAVCTWPPAPCGRRGGLLAVPPRALEERLSSSVLVSLLPMSRAEDQRSFDTLAGFEEDASNKLHAVMGVARPASVAPLVPAPVFFGFGCGERLPPPHSSQYLGKDRDACQIVNWWWTVGEGEAVFLRGSTLVRCHLETKSFQWETRHSDLGGGCRRWRLTNRGLKLIQAVCLTMHG